MAADRPWLLGGAASEWTRVKGALETAANACEGPQAPGAASLKLAIKSLFLAPASGNGPLLPSVCVGGEGVSSRRGRQAWSPIVEKAC